jgi:hypothetical protein
MKKVGHNTMWIIKGHLAKDMPPSRVPSKFIKGHGLSTV